MKDSSVFIDDDLVNEVERNGGDSSDGFVPINAAASRENIDNALVSDSDTPSVNQQPGFCYLLLIRLRIAVATGLMPLAALITSISLPIFILAMREQCKNKDQDQDQDQDQEQASLLEDFFEPYLLVPWMIFALCRLGLLWNSIGHRMDGKPDAEIPVPSDDLEDDSLHVLIALAANFPSFTNAALVGLLIFPEAYLVLQLVGMSGLGILNYFTDFYTDLPDAWRKYVEYRAGQGTFVKPWSEQKLIKPFYKYAYYFGIFVREVLPPLSGVIRASVATQAMTLILKTAAISSGGIKAVNFCLGLTVFASTARIANDFEVVQLENNFKSIGKDFLVDNSLSRSGMRALRILGKIQNGQFLVDLLKLLKLSTYSSVNIILVFGAVGLAAVLQKGEEEYINSSLPEVEVGIAILLGSMGTFARAATVHQQQSNIYATVSVDRVASSDESDRNSSSSSGSDSGADADEVVDTEEAGNNNNAVVAYTEIATTV